MESRSRGTKNQSCLAERKGKKEIEVNIGQNGKQRANIGAMVGGSYTIAARDGKPKGFRDGSRGRA